MKTIKKRNKSKLDRLKPGKGINLTKLNKIKGGKTTNGVVQGLCVIENVDG